MFTHPFWDKECWYEKGAISLFLMWTLQGEIQIWLNYLDIQIIRYSVIEKLRLEFFSNMYYEKPPTMKTVISRTLIEIFCVILITYPLLHIYVFLRGDIEPTKRGFFCDDESLKHPVVKDQVSLFDMGSHVFTFYRQQMLRDNVKTYHMLDKLKELFKIKKLSVI
jgi:hypothetical protein